MRNERFAWVWVYIGTGIVSVAVHAVGDSEAPLGLAMLVSLLGGIGLGIYWYRIYPRPLAKRLFGPTCVVLVLLGLAALDFRPEAVG
ncbi:MAG: hypothetical protein ACJ739_11390, partial [Acidimicrobiales bacterium]